MNKRQSVLAFILIAVLALLSGCKTVPATVEDDVPNATFNAGILTIIQEGHFREVSAAAKQAMQDINVTVTRERISTVDGLILARGPDNSRISVHLQKLDPFRTQIKIRYGVRGNLENSQFIFGVIDSHL